MKTKPLLTLLFVTVLGGLAACSRPWALGGGDGTIIMGARYEKYAQLRDLRYLNGLKAELLRDPALPVNSPLLGIYYNPDGSKLRQTTVPFSDLLPTVTVGDYSVTALQSGPDVFRLGVHSKTEPVVMNLCFDNRLNLPPDRPKAHFIITEQADEVNSAAPQYAVGAYLVSPSGTAFEIPFRWANATSSAEGFVYSIQPGSNPLDTFNISIDHAAPNVCRVNGIVIADAQYDFVQDLFLRKFRDLFN